MPKKSTLTAAEKYERHKAHMRDKIREDRLDARDIQDTIEEHRGQVNVERRESCRHNLQLFCETYKADLFPLAWSQPHIEVLQCIQRTVLQGGQFAIAMPRGNGKTSMMVSAMEWAILYGHHKFGVIVGATDPHAERILEVIIEDLAYGDVLIEDFPEACLPISLIGRDPRKANGQIYKGRPTSLKFLKNQMQLADIPCDAARGIILTGSITGNLRGMIKSSKGKVMRPSLVLIDDPQTDESARSDTQCATRSKKITGELLGLAGPGKAISAFMACTVICPNDLSDQYLDRDKRPEWQGVRTKLIEGWPESFDDLWKQYQDIRDVASKREFYRQHQEEMDAGAVAVWPARKEPGDVSALQHAMDLYFRDPAAFLAEYQNTPLDALGGESCKLRVADIIRRLSRVDKYTVPPGATRLIGYIDVGSTSHIHWSLLALGDDFTGSVIAYGAQRVEYAEDSLEAALYDHITQVVDGMCEREYYDAEGIAYGVTAIGVDAGWQQVSVYRAIKASSHKDVLIAGRGYGLNPGSEFRRAKGGPCPDGWRVVPVRVHGYGALRQLEFHANQWKSFASDRLTSFGKGAIDLYGALDAQHVEYALQLASESRTRSDIKGKKEDVWKVIPGSSNHYWDTFVGALVLARRCGAQLDLENSGAVVLTKSEGTRAGAGQPKRMPGAHPARRMAPTQGQVRSANSRRR